MGMTSETAPTEQAESGRELADVLKRLRPLEGSSTSVFRSGVGRWFTVLQEVPKVMQVAIGMVKSTALYVFLSLPASIWWLGVNFQDAKAAAANPTSAADWFLWSGFAALPVLVAAVGLGAVALIVERRFRPQRATPLFEAVVGGLGYAFVNPFHGLRSLVVNKRYNDLTGVDGFMATALAIFRCGWAIALIAYLAVGLAVVS